MPTNDSAGTDIVHTTDGKLHTYYTEQKYLILGQLTEPSSSLNVENFLTEIYKIYKSNEDKYKTIFY